MVSRRTRTARRAGWLPAVLLLTLGALWGTACGEDEPCARYPDGRFALTRLVIHPDSHPPVGDGTACATCHPYAVIHRENCTGYPFIDMAAVREQVDTQGEQACATCHLPRADSP